MMKAVKTMISFAILCALLPLALSVAACLTALQMGRNIAEEFAEW